MMKEIHSIHTINSIFSTLSAHLLRHFLRLLAICLGAFVIGWLRTLLEMSAKGPSCGTIPSQAQ